MFSAVYIRELLIKEFNQDDPNKIGICKVLYFLRKTTDLNLTAEELYLVMNELDEKPTCELCDDSVRFLSYRKGYSKHCSSSCAQKNKNTRDKIKKTLIERYGVDHNFKNPETREKFKQTCLEKYGVSNPSQTNDFVVKSKQTFLRNYGVDNPQKSTEIKQKVKQTNLRKYGFESHNQSEEVKDKKRASYFNIYGTDHYTKSEEYKRRRVVDFFNRLIDSDRLKDLSKPNFELSEFDGAKREYSWICSSCDDVFEDHLFNGHIPRCPKCYPSKLGSKFEREVFDFCINYEIQSKIRDRKILDGKELDIYIPSYKLGIECDGLYWHSEEVIEDKNYHLNKTLLMKSKGYNLIHIFEDEWMNKRDIVKSILLNKFGRSKTIYARKCKIQNIDRLTARDFLFNNHIQGEIEGNHIGLIHNDKLIMLITFGKSRFNKKYDYEILRFCSKKGIRVIGGLSKLVSHFERENDYPSLITYSDLRYGEGKSYLNCGFEYSHTTKPDFFYSKDLLSRESRIKYQKHKLKNLLEKFDPSLTELENMKLNGYTRIWDCGNNVFIKN